MRALRSLLLVAASLLQLGAFSVSAARPSNATGPVFASPTWTHNQTAGHIVNATINFTPESIAGGLRLGTSGNATFHWFWVRASDQGWRSANATLINNHTQLLLSIDTYPFIRFGAVATRAGNGQPLVSPLRNAAGLAAVPWDNVTVWV